MPEFERRRIIGKLHRTLGLLSKLLLLFFYACPLRAQQLHFRHFTNQHGLSQMVCEAIFQDREGYLWIGTGSGLNRFNGSSFDVFKIRDGLVNDYISALAEDDHGHLWVGTHGGLARRSGDTFLTLADGLAGEQVLSLATRADQLWIGTNAGLTSRDKQGRLTIQQDVPRTPVHALYQSKSTDTLWVGTDKGLYSGAGGHFAPVQMPRLAEQSILGLLEDASRQLIVATSTRLFVLNEAGVIAEYSHGQLGGVPTGGLLRDRVGTIWVGTSSGLTLITGDQIRQINRDNGLPVTVVERIFQDKDGAIWVGGIPGFAKFSGWGFTHYTQQDGLGSSVVRVLNRDSCGLLWAGTSQGLSRFDGFRWNNYTTEDGLSHNYIISLYEDSSGILWIGSRGGLSSYDGHEFSIVPEIDPSSLVFGLQGEVDGTLWVSIINRGLFRLAPDRSLHPVEVPGQTFSRARMLVDRGGRVWISGDRGLTLKEGDSYRTFTTEHGLADNQPYALYEDPWGRLWFSYHSSRGVTLYDGESFQTLTQADGLTDDAVYLLGSDGENQMWFGTTHGIDRFDGHTFRNYAKSEGFVGEECNSGAFIKDDDGTLWFGSMTGLSHYNPKLDPIDIVPTPRVALVSAQMNDMELLGGARLDSHENDLRADVEVLSFAPQERLEVAYFLEGYDRGWHPLEGRRILYTSLPSGPYSLQTRVRAYGGEWSRSDRLVFFIKPPIWQTWWFRICATLGLFLLGLALYKWRVHKIKSTNRQLEALVSTRTQALEQEIQERKKAQEKFIAAQNELVEKAHQMGQAEIAVGVLHNIGNLLCSVNTSANLIQETLANSKWRSLNKANRLLSLNKGDLVTFLKTPEKGASLVEYYLQLTKILKKEHDDTQDEAERLITIIEAIRGFISTHQSYLKGGYFEEKLDLATTLNDALALQTSSISRNEIKLQRQLQTVPPVWIQKSKVIQILICLYKNAKEAMKTLPADDRILKIAIYRDLDKVCLSITDNGHGIEEKHMKRLFTQGFTTKPKGHGFGLHNCANAMREMGGEIHGISDGVGKGATFLLHFQLNHQSPSHKGPLLRNKERPPDKRPHPQWAG